MEIKWSERQCLPDTRRTVIAFLTDWLSRYANHGQSVLWLYGLAGSGKSTIAAQIANDMLNSGRLGGFFYFDRDQPERNVDGLIRTLIYKLAVSNTIPAIGATIEEIVDGLGDIPSTPLHYQFLRLLCADALQSIIWDGDPIVLVIDALDECGSSEDRKSLLDALSDGLSKLPPFIRIIIASRPEADILRVLKHHKLVLPYELNIDTKENKDDIQKYLEVHLGRIREVWHCEATWPGADAINILTKNSMGLMIWVETACLYLNRHLPQNYLPELLGQSTIMTTSTPFERLDNLYKTAIKSSGRWEDPSYATACCSMFGIIVCAQTPLSSSAIGAIMNIQIVQILSASGFGCLLQLSLTQPIRVLHPSFQDYLTMRACNEPWFIDIQKYNQEIALQCMQYLKAKLHDNISGLSLNQQHWQPWLPEALCYTCRYWIEHLIILTNPEVSVRNMIIDLLDKHLLHWIEALAYLKEHPQTIHLLNNLFHWIKVRYLTSIRLASF